eukprot:XP_016664201.1 PREDICTED: uncharacterized protein LOC107885200 [Acyrthosiphon pisum]
MDELEHEEQTSAAVESPVTQGTRVSEENIPEVVKVASTSKESDTVINCCMCSMIINKSDLHQHIKTTHLTDTVAKETNTNSASTTDSYYDSEEILSLSDTEMCLVPQYPFIKCTKSFKYLSWMIRHLQTHNRVQCTMCLKFLSSTESLKRHVMSVHKKKTKTYTQMPSVWFQILSN